MIASVSGILIVKVVPEGELDSDKLMQELEDFLRKQREGGTEA